MPACPRCGRQLATQQTLTYHLNKRMRCTAEHSCKDCSRAFATNAELVAHSRACGQRAVESAGPIAFLRRTSIDSLYVIDRDGVIVSSPNPAMKGCRYADTIQPRFVKHAACFVTASTPERELVQKSTGEYKFVQTQVYDSVTYLLEVDATIKGKLVGTITPP